MATFIKLNRILGMDVFKLNIEKCFAYYTSLYIPKGNDIMENFMSKYSKTYMSKIDVGTF